jgi:hypothetical protein
MLNKNHAELVADQLNRSKKFSSKSKLYSLLRRQAKRDEEKFATIEYKAKQGIK